MWEEKPVTMVMATEGTQVQLAAGCSIIHGTIVVKASPLQKNSGGEVDLALFRPAHSDNTVITRASLTFRPRSQEGIQDCVLLKIQIAILLC